MQIPRAAMIFAFVAISASRGASAIISARANAASINRSGATTSTTRPIVRASSASTTRPVEGEIARGATAHQVVQGAVQHGRPALLRMREAS